MRNGNMIQLTRKADQKAGSYRTYEEWKPAMIIGITVVVRVLTVPMRNGNSITLVR